MFLRLLIESFLRQRRRKLLAGVAILLGTTAVTAMLALATTIGDRIHRELAVYGANIVVFPKASELAVNIGGVDVKPATGNAYLHESDLEKLKTIFWANNITGVSPELDLETSFKIIRLGSSTPDENLILNGPGVGLWFNSHFGSLITGANQLNPLWTANGRWPQTLPEHQPCEGLCPIGEVVIGRNLATKYHLPASGYLFITKNGQRLGFPLAIVGIATTNSAYDNDLILPLNVAQLIASTPDAVSRIEISARTKPEDAFAREDPDTLSPRKREIWYCSPYANSIAYQIREAIPGADATQVRRVEQSEGQVLARISGLMWLVSLAALLAASFAVSAAMATAVLERRREIGLMRSLGASQSSIAALFYAESALLAAASGTLGYLAGSALAFFLGAHIFPGDGPAPLFVPVLYPVVLALALLVAIAGSTPSIRSALRMDPSLTLRADA